MTWEIAHLTDKQKRNGLTNKQKDIKFYNTPAFIPNKYKIIKASIYPHNLGQRPIKKVQTIRTNGCNLYATYALLGHM